MYFVDMQAAVVRKVAPDGTITSIAGTAGLHGFAGDGGPAAGARLDHPHSIALDARGSLYIADIGNHRIRRVDLETGAMETIAGNGEKKLPRDGERARDAAVLGPRALWISGRTLWVALREGNSVWALDLDSNRWRHVAGSGERGFRDGGRLEARFDGPKGIAGDASGMLYVADTENQAIRRVDSRTGEVTTIAGSGPGGRGFGGDGEDARAARFGRPHGIAVGPDGTIYVADTENHRVRALRRVD
jgi:sugar lactone lactonase YvrE